MSHDGGGSYIPKFISDVPWYYKPDTEANESYPKDALAHQRKHPGQAQVDHSEPQAGGGISDEVQDVNGTRTRLVDDYDAKRDRWHGHSADEWDDILAKWDHAKKNEGIVDPETNDSDDTDYELELEELGLCRTDLKTGHIEDPMEKIVRDRRDIPQYILAINSNTGGKIRLGKDSTAGLITTPSDFVKQSQDDVTGIKKLQKFAWDQNQEFEAKQQKEHYQRHVQSLNDPNAFIEEKKTSDINLNLEANPTLMMMKNRQREEEKKRAGDEKRRKLMEMYGS